MSRLDPTESGDRGAIVNIASVAAFDGQIGQAAYAASKGGLVGLTLPVARDLSAVGDPAQHRRARPDRDPDLRLRPATRRRSRRSSASRCCYPKRLGTAEELASMVMECLTNSYMNAETVRVDGGIRMPPR